MHHSVELLSDSSLFSQLMFQWMWRTVAFVCVWTLYRFDIAYDSEQNILPHKFESLPPPLHYNAPGCSLLFCFYSITPAKEIKGKNTNSPCSINKFSIIVPDTHWRVKRVRVRMCWGLGCALGCTARCDAAQNPSCYFNHLSSSSPPSSSPLAPSVSLLLSLCC